MNVGSAGSEGRPIRVQTTFGRVGGLLACNPMLRTLDCLHLAGGDFLTISEPEGEFDGWPFGSGPLTIRKSAVLFITEQSDAAPIRTRPADPGLYHRAPVVLRLGNFVVRGFVHVPEGGTPHSRFHQDGPPFVAVTSAAVLGPNAELAVPFIAVNRLHVCAAQAMLTDSPLGEPELLAVGPRP